MVFYYIFVRVIRGIGQVLGGHLDSQNYGASPAVRRCLLVCKYEEFSAPLALGRQLRSSDCMQLTDAVHLDHLPVFEQRGELHLIEHNFGVVRAHVDLVVRP